jgi:glycosyltransferase involved in cell wall biosynthesis
MSARIYISVPIYNRPELARQCVPTIKDGMDDGDALVLYDDGSTECGADFWAHMQGVMDRVVRTESMGIDAQRRKHILEFLGNREIHGCTHLALIDSDIICDPGWRDAAIALLEKYDAPVCLYRTKTHAEYKNNVFRDHPGEEVIWQRFAPGVFYLLDMAMVEKLAFHMPEKIAWDWWVPGILGYRMAVSRVSHVDHIGLNGLHDRHPPGHVSTERALNPTDWLIRKRAEVLESLGLKDA